MRVGVLALALLASSASAQTARPWTIQAPTDWTELATDPDPLVRVEWWYTESGDPITGLRMRYMRAGAEWDDLAGPMPWGSDRTICIEARAIRISSPRAERAAVPVCYTFAALAAPRVCSPDAPTPPAVP